MKKKKRRFWLFIRDMPVFAFICGIIIFMGTGTLVNAAGCSHSDTEMIDEVPAGCTDNGYTQGIYCNDCGNYISGHFKTSALGHKDTDSDGICDECGEMFFLRAYKKASCTQEGYTGDRKKDGRIIIGSIIPAKGHMDSNKDFVCDTCKEKLTQEPVDITIHYYVTKEYFEENKNLFKDAVKKESKNVPGCMYITEVRTEIQGEEFDLPDFPSINGFVFAWTSGNTVYQKFVFYEDTELYMSYMDRDSSLEGQAGDNAYYIYHPEEKILEFTGTGALWYDFKTKTEIPWYKYLLKSEKVVLGDKLTAKIWTLKK